MKGLYLYCIRAKSDSEFSAEGIGGGKVFVIPYQDLEAVVSEVSLEEFGSEEIQKKAQEDVNWIKEKVKIHEYVIEKSMGKENSQIIPIIPMQFGVVFKTEENLKNTLGKNYQQFQESVEKLQGKEEWGVKAFLNEKKFREVVEQENEKVQTKKKEIESMSQGMAFFGQKQIDGIVDEQKDQELDQVKTEIYEEIGGLASSKNKVKNLEKDFTGLEEEMILNSFYLIEESKLSQFQKKVEQMKEKYDSRGIEVQLTGPWPPYHFA